MNRPVNVHVEWQLQGGNRAPSTLRYVTVAKFPEDESDWPDKAWSVVLEFPRLPDSNATSSEATAMFLMSDAPQERLRSGTVFGMYEGFHRTATVTVL
jgi:hypothetical protein